MNLKKIDIIDLAPWDPADGYGRPDEHAQHQLRVLCTFLDPLTVQDREHRATEIAALVPDGTEYALVDGVPAVLLLPLVLALRAKGVTPLARYLEDGMQAVTTVD